MDVQALGCDFYVFSAHKLFGPTGLGVLYGKLDLLESMEPYQGGGEMIETVSFDGTTYNQLPYKFRALRYAQAIIVPSRSWTSSGFPAPCGPVSVSTIPLPMLIVCSKHWPRSDSSYRSHA